MMNKEHRSPLNESFSQIRLCFCFNSSQIQPGGGESKSVTLIGWIDLAVGVARLIFIAKHKT